jgi:hypothetical protein
MILPIKTKLTEQEEIRRLETIDKLDIEIERMEKLITNEFKSNGYLVSGKMEEQIYFLAQLAVSEQ